MVTHGPIGVSLAVRYAIHQISAITIVTSVVIIIVHGAFCVYCAVVRDGGRQRCVVGTVVFREVTFGSVIVASASHHAAAAAGIFGGGAVGFHEAKKSICTEERGWPETLRAKVGHGNGHWLPAALSKDIQGGFELVPVGALKGIWPISYRERGGADTGPGETVPGFVPERNGDLNCACDQQQSRHFGVRSVSPRRLRDVLALMHGDITEIPERLHLVSCLERGPNKMTQSTMPQ